MVPYMAVQARSYQQLLLSLLAVDDRDELGEKLERDFNLVTSTQAGVSENEGRDKLAQIACRTKEEYGDVMDGLLYGCLTEPSAAEKYLRDVTTLSLLNDQAFTHITNTLSVLFTHKFSKLSETARKQSLWLLKVFTKSGIANLNRIYIPLLRNLTASDHWKNISMIESIMEIFAENKTFLENSAFTPMIQLALLTFIQLIQFHHTNLLYSVIKDKEMDFILDLLRTRFTDCMQIGKELVRCLLQIHKMPKMKEFWNDLANNPKNISPTFTGIPQLLLLRTSGWIFSHKISGELELKIQFLLSKVRAPQIQRYTEIFLKQHLSTPESETLLPEIIRFVCRCVHPSNEILGSDVLQRWNFILILLSVCKIGSPIVNNCLLALFYDWILFESGPDGSVVAPNIMTIEPAILLIMNAPQRNIKLLQKPLIVTLVDYLCRVPFEFFQPAAEKTRMAVVSSFRLVLEKRVVGSLQPVFESVSEELKTSLRKSYPEIFGPDPTTPMPNAMTSHRSITNGTKPVSALDTLSDMMSSVPVGKSPVPEIKEDNYDAMLNDVMEPFLSPKPVKVVNHTSHSSVAKTKPPQEPTLSQCMEQIAESLQPLLVTMKEGSDDDKCSAMEAFVVDVINKGMNYDPDDCEALARTLASILRPIYDRFRMPEILTEESIEDSIQSPLFILFRRLWEESNSPPRERACSLISEMHPHMPKIGFLLIYYLMYKAPKPCIDDQDLMADYEEYCGAVHRTFLNEELNADSYGDYIAKDLELCGQHDHRLMMYLIPFLFRECPRVTKDSPRVCHAIVCYVDAWDMQTLLCLILQKKLSMFSDKGCGEVIKASLSWETIEQTFFWRLFNAHDCKLENWLKELLGEVDYKKHPEATMQVIEVLREEAPREEIVRELLRRDPDPTDTTFVTILLQWTRKNAHISLLAESIGKLLVKYGPSQKKRTLSTTKAVKADLTLDQILGHLDLLRTYMVDSEQNGSKKTRDNSGLVQMLYDQHLRFALQTIKPNVSDVVKEKFRDVFSLVLDDGDDEIKVVAVKKGGKRGRAKPGSRPATPKDSDSEQSDDEDESAAQIKAKRSRRSPSQ